MHENATKRQYLGEQETQPQTDQAQSGTTQQTSGQTIQNDIKNFQTNPDSLEIYKAIYQYCSKNPQQNAQGVDATSAISFIKAPNETTKGYILNLFLTGITGNNVCEYNNLFANSGYGSLHGFLSSIPANVPITWAEIKAAMNPLLNQITPKATPPAAVGGQRRPLLTADQIKRLRATVGSTGQSTNLDDADLDAILKLLGYNPLLSAVKFKRPGSEDEEEIEDRPLK
jgi:hypothetical protein